MMMVKYNMLTKLQLCKLNVTTCIFVLYNVFNRYIIDGRRVNKLGNLHRYVSIDVICDAACSNILLSTQF